MSDIVDFLRARIDEDEQLAREAAQRTAWGDRSLPTWHVSSDSMMSGSAGVDAGALNDPQTHRIPVVSDEGFPTVEQARHIARHDPARVLREVEAKRRIIDRAQELYDDPFDTELFVEYRAAILPGMAAVYSDHPDYQPEWASR
ncbi:DUF6221 family protein [Rhodococcus marinonascens]|uniref:DUF6221 family protein n=1 Tax=Rhodococcus marinonascens TaxID=38311 RepID=UPI000934EB9D|nr:DUF6221 family protein [Rhodococcus marinonascens]